MGLEFMVVFFQINDPSLFRFIILHININSAFANIRIDFPYYIAAFKGDNGFVDFEIYYSVPLNSIPGERIREKDRFRIDQGFYLFDEDWNKITENVRYVTAPAADSTAVLSSSTALKVKPGSYNAALEFKERGNIFFGQTKFNVMVTDVKDTLLTSDILIGIPAAGISSFVGKALDNEIIPRPSLEFSENLIKTYFEVYNLRLEQGRSDFTVNLSIAVPQEKKSGLKRLAEGIMSLFGKKKKAIISNTYNYDGLTPDEHITLNIDISSLKAGDYVLNIEVEDKNRNEKTESRRNFKVLK